MSGKVAGANGVSYRIQDRGNVHAVLRQGPRGGERLIAVYSDRYAAYSVMRTLETYAAGEV